MLGGGLMSPWPESLVSVVSVDRDVLLGSGLWDWVGVGSFRILPLSGSCETPTMQIPARRAGICLHRTRLGRDILEGMSEGRFPGGVHHRLFIRGQEIMKNNIRKAPKIVCLYIGLRTQIIVKLYPINRTI